MSEVEIDQLMDILKELKESGLLDVIQALIKNREDIILQIAEWLKNNQNVMKNMSLLLSAIDKANPDEVQKARSLTEVMLMLKDPDVLAGISYFLTIMKKLGESIR
ncbi:DUF1641 domain-containing protein [Acidianus sulfidivorans JP7]|uniref:DUF1641 domain-containing protein n=1 Tax=Acidianus sulfidivorans JP7 TaxID=619593 RepID=A0A2U9IL78_9CREN|nr:DUF1641 domain-containing protein [Acidianus sulfidivorans]AWR96776.1 DUF1641 domain-containing protein [Acidianus sulfidivorans JP7]